MDLVRRKRYIINQTMLVSGILSMIVSCGLALGYLPVFLRYVHLDDDRQMDENDIRIIETAGEIAFVPSIVIIPFMMQKKGRRIASLATVVPLILSWFISFDARHFTALLIFNILHHISLGGAVTISSIIISEYCSPRYRSTFLMLETAMISLGVLLGHIFGIFCYWGAVSFIGVITSMFSFMVIYHCSESPYWLISQGHMVKGTESFLWLRGDGLEAFKELEDLLKTQKVKLQVEALKPVRKIDLKEKITDYIKSLLQADFLRPLSIMILLFSFVGVGGENLLSNYSLRNISYLANEKYIGTIVLDVLTLVCSLTACVLIQIVKRKTLFLFTGSFSVLFLALTSLILYLQSLEMFSKDYMWIFLSFVTGFVMFMSLGTAALPFSLLGEIFPMSYRGIGSSLTCAYLWAFSNTLLKLIPSISDLIGFSGLLLVTILFMVIVLVVISKIMPDTNTKSLVEIEKNMKREKMNSYEIVNFNENDDVNTFDRLKLFIEA